MVERERERERESDREVRMKKSTRGTLRDFVRLRGADVLTKESLGVMNPY